MLDTLLSLDALQSHYNGLRQPFMLLRELRYRSHVCNRDGNLRALYDENTQGPVWLIPRTFDPLEGPTQGVGRVCDSR